MRAELGDPSGHSTEFGGDASRYLLEWRISDGDVGLRLQRQLSRETDGGDLEDQVELWALARRANRNTKRRRLKLLDGGQKEFDIAEAASKVREITVTRALRLLYLPRLMLQSARVYDLWGDIKHIRGKARYHWDAQPLHLGEVSKEEENVNRAIFKAPIPGSIPDHDPFRPSWWAEQGSDTCPCAWRTAANPRDWRDDEAGSLVRRMAPWIKIGLSWTSPKRLKREDEQTRALARRRIDRVETVIRELQALARAAGRVYTPPAPKKPVEYFGSHKARPIDRWQDRAECSGRVEVTDELRLYIAPPSKKPVKFVDGRPVWQDRVDRPTDSNQCRRIADEVEKPPISAGLPQLLELSKLTRKTVNELAKMNYCQPPAMTPFVRAQMARLRIHRLRHWRWGGKAHWADRVRSNRWQGFLCEGPSLPRAD
jgi:hypothetical protein